MQITDNNSYHDYFIMYNQIFYFLSDLILNYVYTYQLLIWNVILSKFLELEAMKPKISSRIQEQIYYVYNIK